MEDRCVICGEVIPEGTMVCPVCAKEDNNPVTPDFICEQLAKLFDRPCNLIPASAGREWCEKHCGKVSAADCWMQYFKIKYKEGDGKC